ncbi:MAG: hypothetical protein ACOCTI_05935 [Phycisphaeraceae bacterium]
MNDPEDILDLSGQPQPPRSRHPAMRGRPWLAVRWRCCSVYSRIYRNRRGDAYEGRCPRCARPVRAQIGPGGTSARFFEAG